MEPITTPHSVGAAPKLEAYLSAVGTMMYVFTCKDIEHKSIGNPRFYQKIKIQILEYFLS